MIEIIPAIDLIDGRCVRLEQGDFAKSKVYSDDPVETARRFEAAGFRRLHVVDLDGARRGAVTNIRVLERIANATSLTIDFGGGIKTAADVAMVLGAGAAIATVGSVAARDPDLFFGWIGEFGSERLLLGADVRGRKLAIDGWQTETAIDVVDFLKRCAENGVTSAFVTDVARDGLLAGPSVDLYRELIDAVPSIALIASGGVASTDDLVALETAGCRAAIVGKALYENRICWQNE